MYPLNAVFMESCITGIRGGRTLGMEDLGKLCWKEVFCLNFEDWVECQGVERWKRDGARKQNLQGRKCRLWPEYSE